MPLLPISTVRTSTPLTQQRLLFQLNADQLALQRQYDQLSSGRRLLQLGDDPAAAARSISLQRGIDRSEQLSRNANSTQAFYNSADDALGRIDNALIEARAASVQSAQNVLSEDEREALAITVRQTINSVFAGANSIARDHQLLGGILEPENAFEFDGEGIVFRGSDAVGQTKVGIGQPTQTSVTAEESLGAYATFLEGDSLNAALDLNTRLVDMRGGRGVEAGAIRISGGGDWTEFDLRNASTIGDVVDIIDGAQIDGRALSVSIGTDSFRIEYADGLSGTLAVSDGLGSKMAEQLAVDNPDGIDAPPLIGDRLSPRVTANTKISDLNGGLGIDLTGGIRIEQSNETYDIDFGDAETVGDILIGINRSSADVKAELNEEEGRIRLRALRSGVDYSVGENGGVAAESLGIRSATEQTRLEDLGRGRGLVLNNDRPDLLIVRPDGVELELELGDAATIEDVITLIRDHPLNQDTRRVLVDLNDVGNGLQLKAPPGAGSLTVRQIELSDAGIRLGLIPPGTNESTGSLIGSVDTIIGQDYDPRDAGGALDSLLRLEQAIRDGDIPEIERLQQRVDIDLDRSSRTRGRIGIWSQTLQGLETTLQSNATELKSQLSDEVDADLATVISELNARQAALEASMRFIGQASQITLLNYL
tara:strand:- start:60493 stop:62448 length:1956 start_codon:yes stop_codon:yes gene_type:complete